jgi:heme-degrading monooxygenase HmoA
MAVLVTHTAAGMDTAAYDRVSPEIIEKLRDQPGFLLHLALPGPEGIVVTEIWESQEQHDTWFDEHVAPNVPAEIRQEVVEIHNIVEPAGTAMLSSAI